MGQNQVKSGKKDDDEVSTPILLSTINSNHEDIERQRDLHWLAFLGYKDEIKAILQNDDFSGESITRKVDPVNKTPVHNAAIGGGSSKIDIVSMLLKHDLDDIRSVNLVPLVNVQDMKEKSVLHYAVASRRPDLVSKLLNDFNADPNIVDLDGCTPLHVCAAQGYSEEAVTCLEVLLKCKKINPYQTCGPQKHNQTALHLASENMADKMVHFLLKNGFDHSTVDNRGFTPLMVAVSAGDTPEAVACVKALLSVSDIKDVNAKSQQTGQTALHMAAYKCHKNVLKVLLEDININIWILDNQRRNALHWATEAWFRSQSLPCVKLLVECDKLSDSQAKATFLYGDNTGDPDKLRDETAMDIALKHKAIRIAEYLIQAHPDPETWLDDKTMDRIYKTLPEAMTPLLNKAVTYNPAKFHERDESIDANFGAIVGYKEEEEPKEKKKPDEKKPEGDQQQEEDGGQEESEPKKLIRHETKFLHQILNSPKEIQRNLLLHPLVQIFIDLKWKKIRLLTWIGILFQFTWLMLYTVLVFEAYIPNCQETVGPGIDSIHGGENNTRNKTKALKILLSLGFYSKEDSNIRDCEYNTGAAMSIVIVLYVMSVILIIKEIFQGISNPRKYVRSYTNWAQIPLLAAFFVNSYPVILKAPQIPPWQIYLAAAAMFVGWVLSLREIAKIPGCGIYSAMLKRVFLHCCKMVGFYIPLLVAFSVSLMLLIPGKGQYNYLFFGIVKVLVMMTGELDFEDSFYDETEPRLALNFIFGQFVFLLLVFVTTIVLLNLLTGLAVNDVQSLVEEAEINRLSNQLEQIFLLESLLLLIRNKLGNNESLNGFFNQFNVTSFKTPYYYYFASKISGIETRPFSPDLKIRIKAVMVPDESND